MVTKRVEVYNPEGDLVYPKTTADVVQLVDAGNKFTSENVEDALQEVGTSLAGKAATNQSFYLGTTQIAINRGCVAVALTGITSIDGNAATSTTSAYLGSYDTRAVASTPETLSSPSLHADFKQNTVEGLSDGSAYLGELTFRPYGVTTDWSGGPAHQLGFTYNGNVHHRWGTSTTWGSWYKFWDSNNFDPTTKADLAGATFSGAVTATTFTGSGAGLTSITAAQVGAVGLGDIVQNTNPFGGKKLYINTINNALFLADKRWTVTGNFYNTSDDSLVGAISASILARLFDGNYESSLDIPVNQYALIDISFAKEASGYFPNYPYGTVYISHYDTGYTASTEVSVYCNYAAHTIGWHTVTATDFFRGGSGALIKAARLDWYNISEMKIKLCSSASLIAQVTQLEFALDRPATTPMPFVDKYNPNTLYKNIAFSDGSTNTITLYPSTGNVYATTFNGSGAGLTSIPNTALANSKVTIGTTDVVLGGSSTSFAGLNTLSFASGGYIDLRLGTSNVSRGIQFDYASLGSLIGSAGTMLGSNVYINPSDAVNSQVRIKNTHAYYGYAYYKQVVGTHTWYGATGSVTADDIVSPTTQMTLSPTGLTVVGKIAKSDGTSTQFLKADGSVDATTYIASGGALGTPTSGNLANCTFPTLNQSTTGSAATLTTPRTIALNTGVTGTATGFDGSANITIPVTAVAASYLTGTIPASVLGNSTVYIGSTAVPLNRATGNLALTGITSIDGSSASCTGNAATATKLAASKTIALSGDVTGTATAFDGSANITLTTTLSDTGVTDALLTNYVVGTNTALAATNSILTAFQNTQAQINAKLNATAQAADSAKLGGTAAASYALTSAIPVASSATPAMDGTGAAGTGTAWAKGDHVHPTDTSRAAVGQTFYIGTTALAINRASAALDIAGITSVDSPASGTITVGGTNASTVNIGTATTTQAVNIGTGSGVTTINIGGSGDTVNIAGTLAYVNTTDLNVTDKLITLNKGGAASSGNASGISIEENAVAVASVVLGNSRASWSFTVPAKAGSILLTPSASAYSTELISSATANRQITFPDATGTVALTSGIPTASSTTPAMNGTAAVGTGTTWARADHIHPTDTTRQAAYTLLTTFGSLASAAGWLYNNGSGVLSYSSPTKSTVGLANVENTALSTWVGTSNITTLGTVATGIWHGTALADAYIASAATWNAKQAAYTILTTFGSLSNATGWLYNNGSGTLSYITPTAAQVGADASGAATSAVSTHAALQTGVHGIAVTSGKTFSCSNTLTLAGTDSSTLNIGSGGTLGTGAFTVAYSLPTATSSVLGGVKPDGTSILNSSGVLSATPTSIGALASATNDNATSTACYPVWVSAAGNTAARISASTFTWIPSTGTLGITTLQATGNVTAYYSSDRRLKQNIKPLDNPLEKLSKIRGVSFDWTDAYINQQGGEDGFFVRKHDVGVIAQEVQEVMPEVVGERLDGYLGVRYEKLVPLLIEAIKSQQVQIDDLKKQIARLA